MTIIKKIGFALCASILVIITGCGGGSSSTSSTSNQESDFNKTTSVEALNKSFLTVPANIQLAADSSSGKIARIKKNHKSLSYDGLWANNYSPITDTIDYSSLVKKNVVSLLKYVFDTYDIAHTPLNTFTETGEGEIWAYKLEDISQVAGEEFKWKLSLYLRFSQTADVVHRFSFVNGKMKGRILENGYTTSTITRNEQETTLTTYLAYDIRFDGTSSPQTLEINYVKDLSETFSFVELYWDSLTDEQWDIIKLGQIGKSSVKIVYDGTEYGITGTAYAPGADLESVINQELKLFGDDHSTYSFRAKSIVGSVDGAKMEVALPTDTQEDVSEIWTTSAVSKLFETNLLNFTNGFLNQLLDTNDDTALTNTTYVGSTLLESVDFSGNVTAENRIGAKAILNILGDKLPIPTLAAHGNTITQTEYDNAVVFWGSNNFTDFNLLTITELNAFLASTDIAITDAQKQQAYYLSMAPTYVAIYQTTPAALTITDINDYLTRKADFFSLGLKNLIAANSNLYNPAFFEASKGFLGTFDGTNFYGYNLSSDTLIGSTKPENFDALNALDLEVLPAIPPNDVFNLTIDVK